MRILSSPLEPSSTSFLKCWSAISSGLPGPSDSLTLRSFSAWAGYCAAITTQSALSRRKIVVSIGLSPAIAAGQDYHDDWLSGGDRGKLSSMDRDIVDRLEIRALVENWVVWRDARD